MNKQYYLVEKAGSTEGFILFWAKGAKGYTIEFDKAGLFDYEFVKDQYLGKSSDTVAIEHDKFLELAKIIPVVYNHHEIMREIQ